MKKQFIAILATALTLVSCQVSEEDLLNMPVDDPNAVKRAYINGKLMQFLFPHILQKKATATYVKSTDQEIITELMGMDDGFSLVQDSLARWCEDTAALRQINPQDPRIGELEDRMKKLLRFINDGPTVGEQIVLNRNSTLKPASTRGNDIPLLPPSQLDATLLTNDDRMKLFSALYIIDVLQQAEATLPAKTFKDLPSYAALNQEIDGLAAAIEKADPKKEEDLLQTSCIKAQQRVVKAAMQMMTEFYDRNLSKYSSLAKLTGTAASDMNRLQMFFAKMKAIAKLNDVTVKETQLDTRTAATAVEELEILNRHLPNYISGLKYDLESIRQRLVPIVLIPDQKLKLTQLCLAARDNVPKVFEKKPPSISAGKINEDFVSKHRINGMLMGETDRPGDLALPIK